MSVTPQQAIDAANEVFGSHPGYRALHAKGVLVKGTFTATPEVSQLTRAPHLQAGSSVPATIRFSNGAGKPDAADYAPDPRGMAVKLYLPDGSRTDIVAQTSPRFPVHTPEAFVELLRAQASPWRMPLFLLRHPETLRALPVARKGLVPPESFARCTYYALHAFRFVNEENQAQYVRYTLAPEAGDQRISPAEAKRRGRDYLHEEIRQRVTQGPVRFSLELQLAETGDPVDDPWAMWPSDRPRVSAGALEITGLDTERETGEDILVFDPTRVTDGIELSDDPVLQFRKAAYGESVARRTS
ncbi:MAG TPA: catalase family peroxidase [Solirubrobacteraceae bacterium]|jgi:catalase